MAVVINKTNGTQLTSVPDGTVNGPGLTQTSSSLFLLGRNYTNYGELVNENFVRLLENFASDNPPVVPTALLTGQLWYDTANSQLKLYGGNGWKTIGTVQTGGTQPTLPVPQDGDMWYDTVNAQLKIYGLLAQTSSGVKGWKTVGPAYTYSQSQTGSFAENIQDTNGTDRTCIVFRVNNTPISVFSKQAFTIYNAVRPQYPGIGPGIVPGLNFVHNNTIPGFTLAADGLDAVSIGGVSLNNLLRKDQSGTVNGSLTLNNNNGLIIGTVGNVQLSTDVPGAFNISNSNPGTSINLKTTGTTGSTITLLEASGLTTTVNINGSLNVAGNISGGGAGGAGLAVESVNTSMVKALNGQTTIIDATDNNDVMLYGTFVGNVVGNLTSALATISGNVEIGGLTTIAGMLYATGGAEINGGVFNSGRFEDPIMHHANINASTLNSPTLTGTPVAPTQDVGNNSTAIATTAFVKTFAQNLLPTGAIIMWSGSVSSIPGGWLLCDGSQGTPNLVDRFVIGAGGLGKTQPASTGGSKGISTNTGAAGAHSHNITLNPHALTVDELPPHTHNVDQLFGQLDDVGGGAAIDRNGASFQYYNSYGNDGDNDTGGQLYFYTRTLSQGAGQAHSHTGQASYAPDHSHALNITDSRPPFYALCFIMKSN
jgi:hypothetical protein